MAPLLYSRKHPSPKDNDLAPGLAPLMIQDVVHHTVTNTVYEPIHIPFLHFVVVVLVGWLLVTVTVTAVLQFLF